MANLGVSVVVDGSGLRVIFPELTGERRQQLMKVAKEKLEDARVALRRERNEVVEDLNSKNRFVQFEIGEKNELDDLGSQFKRVTMDYDGEKFYSLLDTRLSTMLDRTGQTFDLITTAVGPDLDLYITVQDASLSGISQEKPSFTNISNGLGVFSYRLTKTYPEFKMTQTSAVQLFEGPYTFDLFRCCRHGSQSNTEGVIPCRQ